MLIKVYALAVIVMLFSGLPAWLIGRRSAIGERSSAMLLAAGAMAGLAATVGAVIAPLTEIDLAWSLPGGHILLRLDGLAAIFLLPAFLVSGLGAIYGLGYWPHHKRYATAGRLRLWYGILAAVIVLLPTCRNGVLFLVVWEVMAIAGFMLILTEQEKKEVRRAAFVYLAATHAGTLALYAMFILLVRQSGSFDFPAVAALNGTTPIAAAIFLLALFGFGLKAGIMPLHIWLPGAHAAAPSHVSALMSGVMIKMGIYGIVRLASFFGDIPPWWGWTVLSLGAVSGVMGVAFAIAQHDIKRLLAYHSVENIGIILLGLGVALLGKSFGQPALMALGLAGALLHVINHGLFKSLLFLSAGSLINATGTRQIDQYGGLLRRLPATALFFLGGAVAICGLPPLNGFVSEWLIYLGLLHSQAPGAPLGMSMLVVAAPILAIIGALAVACFVKVFGVTFLGEPRKPLPSLPTEAPLTMILPMAVILGCCGVIGIMPLTVVDLLGGGIAAWGGAAGPAAFPATLAPVGWISVGALLFLGLTAILALLQRRAVIAPKRPATWGCGYPQPTSRMQYTAASFAEMLTGLFHWGLWTDIEKGEVRGFFPERSHGADHTPDVILDRMIYPGCHALAWVAFKTRSFLQHGVLGIYLLYSALTTIVLLYILL
ncbi:MAG: hydrogenase [Deltaproteobacteria bacterium CG23_combo_of_CG06-09_8_20_14_all_60_8]|nr:MAG: hydrogenase [Deltaproteobacteria bacterium CG23_combo_of_CG06-09_8_20_14_all_60_8]